MDVDVEALRWFVEVADGATVGETAARHHRSQPAVTRGLQRLAAEVGAPLTDRVGRRVRLTHAGSAFLLGARRALVELDDAVLAVAEANDPAAGTVRLGFLSPLGAWLVPELLAAFRAERPRVRFELRYDGASRILDALVAGDLDLLLTSAPDGGELRWEPLFAEELVLAVPTGHRLALPDPILPVSPRDLAGEPWVLQPEGYGLRRWVEDLCRSAGFEPTIALEGNDLTTVYALIAAGSGIGLFPTSPPPPRGVRQVPLRPSVRRTVGLVTVPGRVRSPAAEAFADVVRGRRLLP